jgi:hypothetical protein
VTEPLVELDPDVEVRHREGHRIDLSQKGLSHAALSTPFGIVRVAQQ